MTEVGQDKKNHEQLLADFNAASRSVLEADLKDVSKWLKCKIQDLSLRPANLPAERFHDLVEGLLASYAKCPAEKRRMEKILNKIQSGEPLLPVFIEENDPDNFIMEGRHRIVAFCIAKTPVIPVVFASKSPKSELKITPNGQITPLKYTFRKDSGQISQDIMSKYAQFTANTGVFNGTYGILLDGDVDGTPARWFFRHKEELTRGDLHNLYQGFKDPAFRQQFLQPEEPESLHSIEAIEQIASKHFSGVSVLFPGGNSEYSPAWASLMVIAVDTKANEQLIKSLKGIEGLRIGKAKDQTYLMPDLDDYAAHVANAALLDWLSRENLLSTPKKLETSVKPSVIYPKLTRPETKLVEQDTPASPLAEEIEAIRHIHPESADVRLKKLKSGIDEFSRMKVPDLKEKIAPEELAVIERRLKSEKSRLNAMRWAARGLPVDLAVRKVVLMEEDRDHFVSVHQSSERIY